MDAHAKLEPGDVLVTPWGERRIVVDVQSGKLPTAIELIDSRNGSAAARCVRFGETSGHERLERAREVRRLTT